MQAAALRARAAVRRLPLTVAVMVLLVGAEAGEWLLDDARFAQLSQWASTNVDRLTTEPFLPILVSPFVVDGHRWLWLPIIGFGLAVTESRVRWERTLVAVAGGHIAGTFVSEAIVWWRVGHGRLPASAREQLDVGISYVAVAALVAAVVVARSRAARLLAAGLLIALGPSLVAGLGQLRVSAVGHVTALAVSGMVFCYSWLPWVRDAGCRRHRRRSRWFRRRIRGETTEAQSEGVT